MNEITPTVVINQSKSLVLEAKPLAEGKKTVTPVYTWKTGRTMFLSKKEKVVADTFLETRSYAECERALRRENFNFTWQSCRRWLEKNHVKEYLTEQFEERGLASGWTREHWVKVMTDHLQGKVRLANGDLYGMRLIANVMKFEMPENVSYTQINFTEKAA